ncbi:ATPase family gene 2 protein homolog A-like [Tubulanus polymorphus]|uniref:ATPase family gene 2 protein homolog A-like n=1 Tax=Tubulanus polymorphus TaxID=672921 RepID=UPI003DA4A976
MPPKSKSSSKTELVECNSCGAVISYKSGPNHKVICEKQGFSRETDVQNLLDSLDHGFIDKDGVFYGLVDFISLTENAYKPPKSALKVVCLQPVTMKMCGLSIGQPVIIDKTEVFFAWPNTAIGFTTLGILSTNGNNNDIGLNAGQKVPVIPINYPHIEIHHLQLVSKKPLEFASNPEFVAFMKHSLMGNFLCKKSKIRRTYYGQPCSFSISQLVASIEVPRVSLDKTDLDDSIHEMDSVSEDLRSLTLQSTPKSHTSNRTTESLVNNSSSSPCTPMKDTSFHSSMFKTPPNRMSTVSNKPAAESSQKFYVIGQRTQIDIVSRSDIQKNHGSKPHSETNQWDKLGGLNKQKDVIRDVLDSAFIKTDLYKQFGLALPKGILLYGPSGTGKTLITRAIAQYVQQTAGVHVIRLNGPEIFSRFYGETESRLRGIFEEAHKRGPSLLIIDEIDAMCPKRDSGQNEIEKRVVSTLLSLMDGLATDKLNTVLVIAATNKPDILDPALRRPGRLDKEIEITVPDGKQRAEILLQLLNDMRHDLSIDDIHTVSDGCHGYVGADLASLCKEAGLHAIKKSLNNDGIMITMNDIEYALQMVQPSAMREVAVEVPKVLWSDIGGQETLKMKLKQAVEWPLKHPEAFERMGIQPPKGLLMYGPPGCSKTMTAKALATESGLNFLAIKGPELFSKWVGESERAVREVFRRARAVAPSVVFFDEIDALAVERGSSSGGSNVGDRVLAQLLTEMDGVESLVDVTVIAATNRPDMVDKALMRPGRIDRVVYVPLPDKQTRRAIFEIKFRKMPVDDDVIADELVERTENYSGAEVTAVCNEAALFALQEDINAQSIQMKDFKHALDVVKPRTTKSMINFYTEFQQKFGLKSV